MQINMYNAVISLVGNATNYISMHMDQLDACERTIERIRQLEHVYGLAGLNPNLMAGFEYQAALCYALNKVEEKAVESADKFVEYVRKLFSDDMILLHGDDYFNKIEKWFEQMEGGANAPRNRKLVLDEVKQYLSHPAFAVLEGNAGFKLIKEKLAKIQ